LNSFVGLVVSSSIFLLDSGCSKDVLSQRASEYKILLASISFSEFGVNVDVPPAKGTAAAVWGEHRVPGSKLSGERNKRAVYDSP
jgi:hypothetical protein